jgi:DNA-binding response OmpR family regulator
MLRYAGHDVIEAAGGREALDRLGREADRIDLMIVDYVMPDMNGLDVARLARLRRPGLPTLFVTGFADTTVLAAEASADHILRKPFTVAELVMKIDAVLRIASTRLGRSRS